MPDEPAPLPSRSQIKRLGSRLRQPNPPAVDDLELLEQVRAAYGHILDQVVRTLLDHELPSTGRLKTTRTIVEKLQRNPSMGLLTMQDIAGTRIVAEMDRVEQDRTVRRVVGLFLTQTWLIDGPSQAPAIEPSMSSPEWRVTRSRFR